jgi:ligand-binding sensor domain-containing protein
MNTKLLPLPSLLYYLVLLGLLLEPHRIAYAQLNAASFDHISVEEGLSQSVVRTIYKDRQGYMWFGTLDGLNKYDGYSFIHYKHNPFDSTSLSDNEVSAIMEDSQQNMWIGTAFGLNKWDRKTNRFLLIPNMSHPEFIQSGKAFTHPFINAIHEDKWKTLWVATYQGLKRVIPMKDKSGRTVYIVRHFLADSSNIKSLSSNYIKVIYEDKGGSIWIGSSEGLNRLLIRNPQASPLLQQIEFENEHNSSNQIFQTTNTFIEAIVEDKFGTLWLGTHSGLNRINPKTHTLQEYHCQHSKPNPSTDDVVIALLLDKQNDLWIGSQTNGICKFTLEDEHSVAKMVHYKEEPFSGKGLRSNMIYSLYESHDQHEDVVWIGTQGAGVNKYSRAKNAFTLWNRITNMDNSSGLNSTFAVCTDQYGILWIGTVSGLVGIDRKNYMTIRYTHNPDNPGSISNGVVGCIFEDKKGDLWVGTHFGLNHFNRKTKKFKRFVFNDNPTKRASENNIKTIYEDRLGTFWVGTTWDLKKFDPLTGKTISYTYDPERPTSLKESYVTSITEDKEGHLWVGTHFGLNRFDRKTGQFVHYIHQSNDPRSLISSSIWCILPDKKGNLWICTDKGLNKLEWINTNQANFIHYTEQNGLSNNFVYGAVEDSKGFIWLSTNLGISRLDPTTGKFRNYDVGDGLPNNEFNEGAFHRSADGELFFGGNNGVVSFNPHALRNNLHVPSMAITAFQKFGQSINIDSIIASSKEIRLSYKENFFSFEFVALDYTNPRKNQYAYKLEGVDENWIYSNNRHFANFTNLNPGTYTFRVKGSNSDGVWNEDNEATITIVITPPFWRRYWFYALVILVVSGLIKLFYDYRVKRKVTLLMQMERVKLAENERVRKLAAEDLHDEFGNKLTRISLLTELIKARLNGHSSEVEHLLNKISDNSSQLYQGTKDFIWSINPDNDSLYEVAVRLKDFGDDIFDKTSINFQAVGIQENLQPIILPMGNSRHVILLFKEALSNVLKHSQAQNAELRFTLEGETLSIGLSDDGRGFEKGSAPAGNGLINMQSRAKKLGGHLSLCSGKDNGTSILLTVHVPVPEKKPEKMN